MTDGPMTIRTVIPHAHVAPRCMEHATPRGACCLPRGHRDGHLPMPHYPAPDISDTNPAWAGAAA